jgi:hypothetical protein
VELAAYIGIIGLACVLAVRPRLFSSGVFAAFCFGTFLALSVIVRLDGFDADMATYAERMHYTGHSSYYLREPVVWYGHRLFWTLTRSEAGAFIITDMALLSVMFFAFKRLQLPQYAYISILAFFPFIMGMQNVYRQFAGSIFFIAAIAAVTDRKYVQTTAFAALSALSHNVSAIFVPLLPMLTRYRRLAFPVGLIVIPLAIYIGGGTKSGAETGASLEWVYVALLTAICGAIFFLENGHRNVRSAVALLTILALQANIAAAAILASATAERVSLFTLLSIYPMLVMAIEKRVREKFLLRCATAILGFIPILMAGTRIFILGE